jgi:hypothetical protein
MPIYHAPAPFSKAKNRKGAGHGSDIFQIRYTEEGLDAEGIINEMILLEREPDRLKKGIVFTVNTICKISGKSLRSIEITFSLLKLPEEIQNGSGSGQSVEIFS